MTDKPRHRWLQIHLSTAIVLMFVAGGLTWANATKRVYAEWSRTFPATSAKTYIYGFPLWYFSKCVVTLADGHEKVLIPDPYTDYVIDVPVVSLRYGPLTVDILFVLLVLGMFAVMLEWLIRRREDRN